MEQMHLKQFLRRNKTIIIFGLVLAIVFTFISFLQRANQTQNRLPGLKKISDDIATEITTTNQQVEETTPSSIGDSPVPTPINNERTDNKTYTTIEIRDLEGVFPKEKTVNQGENIIWINTLTTPVQLVPVLTKYPDFAEPKTLQPQESLNYTVTVGGTWPYKVVYVDSSGKEVEKQASLFVFDEEAQERRQRLLNLSQ